MSVSVRKVIAFAALAAGFALVIVWLAGTGSDSGTGQRRLEPVPQTTAPVSPGETVKPKPVPEGNNSDKATLRIPALGEDWSEPILDGVGDDVLDSGVLGRFPESTVPGGEGNYSLAGHRVTHGEPFRDLPELDKGDELLLESGGVRYTYQVTDMFVVNHEDVSVLAPVNNLRIITLVTCNSLAPTDDRLIVRGVLTGAKRL